MALKIKETSLSELELINQNLLEGLKARDAELAVIKGVQEGITSGLDIDSIFELAGERITQIFPDKAVGLYTYDPETKTGEAKFILEDGARHYATRFQAGPIARKGVETKKPFMLSTRAEFEAMGALTIEGTEPSLSGMYTPFVVHDSVVGALNIESAEEEHAFTESDLMMVSSIARSISVALENARLFDALQRSNSELTEALVQQTATSEILHVMADAHTDVSPVLIAVAENAARLFKAIDVQIYRVDGDLLRQATHFGPSPSLEDGETLPLVPGLITGRAVLERRTVHVEDLTEISESEFPESVQYQERFRPTRSVIATPLLREENAIGAIVVRRNEVQPFTEQQIALLTIFAHQAAIAIENVDLFHESEQRAAELATINTVGQALVAESDLDALIQLIGEQIRETFSADIVYVALIDEGTDVIQFPYSYGEELNPLPLGDGLTGKIIETGEPLLINRDMDKRRAEMGVTRVGVRARSYLGVPIQMGDRTLGVISVQSTGEEGRFDQNDLRILDTIAANVGTAIRNAQLFDEIKRQNQYNEAVIENSPAAIVLLDLEANITGWNPAAEKLFGYTEVEALGRNVDDLVAKEEDLHAEAVRFSRKALSEKQIHLLARRTRKDGSFVDVEVSGVPIAFDGVQEDFMAIYHDVTEIQRARQAAEEANQAKSIFLANMSHELRTPLNAIIGFTRIVRRKGEGVLPGKQVQNLDKVLISAEHLLNLINSVLDISKIEAGRMDVHSETFELPRLINFVVGTSQPLLHEGVELETNIQPDLQPLTSDQDMIRQILINLLSNAAKFTHRGKIVIAARQDGSTQYIDVSDTGLGVSEGDLERIFEEFRQADSSMTREYGGTGLGLAISRNLARLLGGDLTVSSVEGEGSMFTISIPTQFGGTALNEGPEPGPSEKAHSFNGHPLALSSDGDPNVH